MHNCDLMEGIIIDLTFDEISFDQRAKLLEEIEQCKRCRDLYHSISETLLLNEKAGQIMMPKEDYWPKYNEKLRSKILEDSQAKGWYRPGALFSRLNIFTSLPAPVIAVIILIIVSGGFWYLLTHSYSSNNSQPDIVKQVPEKKGGDFSPDYSPPKNGLEDRSRSFHKETGQTRELRQKEKRASLVQPEVNNQIDAGQPTFELDVAHHFEEVQMLLRSVRNSSSSNSKEAVDISYEKRLSRELLGRNIAFRHNADRSGNVITEELLESVEILLIDISNLPDRASQNDLLIIKNVLEREKLIAALQPYATPSSE